ncbi:MAG: TetR/AcrR family transcriptional regulator [Gammaproteobacteria bacterium]
MDAKVPQKRAGRPSDDQRREVRGRLAAAARELFGSRGFAAVTVREVAQHAGVTPAMVNYYFRGKHGLFLAVLEDLLEEALAGMEAAGESITGPGGIRIYLDRHVALLAENPWVAPLIYREVVLNPDLPSNFVAHFPGRLFGLLRRAVVAAQRRGELDPEPDADFLVISIVASSVFPFLMRPVIETLTAHTVDDAFARQWASHAGRMFYRGAAG